MNNLHRISYIENREIKPSKRFETSLAIFALIIFLSWAMFADKPKGKQPTATAETLLNYK